MTAENTAKISELVSMNAEDTAAAQLNKPYRIGTLQYTKIGVVSLFLWLLLGSFCFTLMECVVPYILPLKLKSLNASNMFMGLVLTTIPAIFNASVCPAVSFYSDRYRSRLGRRIPFILLSTPFITLFLVLIGYSQEISKFLLEHVFSGVTFWSITGGTLFLLAVFVVGFQFFNMFVSSVYYYLFNDVVPEQFLSRFMSLFRIVGTGAGAFFNFVIFKYAETYIKEIFLWAAVLYFIAFMLMCFKIKEGDYPPPPANIGNKTGLLAGISTFCVECFSSRYYWYIFLASASFGLAGSIPFGIFYYKSLGFTLEQVGKISGLSSLAIVILLYPAGMLCDRYHPVRAMLAAAVFMAAATSLNFIFLFCEFSTTINYVLIIAITLVNAPALALCYAAELPMFMKLLPKAKYGQFGSAGALIRSLGVILGGLLSGVVMDWLTSIYKGSMFCYRYVPVWVFLCFVPWIIFLLLVYRGWKNHGGDENYVPPETEAARSVCQG